MEPTMDIEKTTQNQIEENINTEKKDNVILGIENTKQENEAEKKPSKKRSKQVFVTNKDKTVEIRNGKLIFHETPTNFMIHPTTIIELAYFHQMKPTVVINNSIQLEDILNSFSPLICKLIQENDKPLSDLALFVKGILCPSGFGVKDSWEDILVLSLLEDIIVKSADRVSYSIPIQSSTLPDCTSVEGLTVYRWEVKNLHLNFSQDLINLINSRRQIRQNLHKEAIALYSELTIEDREFVTAQASLSKKKRKPEPKPSLLEINADFKAPESKPVVKPVSKSKHISNAEIKLSTKAVPKTQTEEKKAPKNTVSIKGFFTPVKKDNNESNALEEEKKLPIISDYEKYFHPFRVKQDMYISKPKNEHIKVVYNSNDFIKFITNDQVNFDANKILEELKQDLLNQNKIVKSNTKHNNSIVVSDSEEDSENDSLVFVPTGRGIKPKLLYFHEDVRPPFYGAWLKKSNKINARNPLCKDEEVLDYDFDSELEWQEEEEEGELLEDSEDEDEDEDEDFDSNNGTSESENDDWLIKEDDVDASGDEKPIDTVKKTKRGQLTILKPIVHGVVYDVNQCKELKVKDKKSLASFCYSFCDDSIRKSINPFAPIPLVESSSTTTS